MDKKMESDSNLGKRERSKKIKWWSKSKAGGILAAEKGADMEEHPEPTMESPGDRAELSPRPRPLRSPPCPHYQFTHQFPDEVPSTGLHFILKKLMSEIAPLPQPRAGGGERQGSGSRRTKEEL